MKNYKGLSFLNKLENHFWLSNLGFRFVDKGLWIGAIVLV